MSSLYVNSSINNDNIQDVNSAAKNDIKKEQITQQQQRDGLLFAFLEVLQSVNIQQETAQTQAKALQVNALEQEKLNSAANQLNFSQMSWNQMYKHVHVERSDIWELLHDLKSSNISAGQIAKAKAAIAAGKTTYITIKKTVKITELHNLTSTNLQVEKERGYISNQIVLEQQTAQVGEAQLNTAIDSQEQSSQICSSLAQMLRTLTSQIDNLNP